MTPEEFVKVIRVTVHDAAIRGTESNLDEPPGRRPSVRDVELSVWFRGLSLEDRARVMSVVRHSVHRAVFGLFCVPWMEFVQSRLVQKDGLIFLTSKGTIGTH